MAHCSILQPQQQQRHAATACAVDQCDRLAARRGCWRINATGAPK
jgi:hypothetical protein